MDAACAAAAVRAAVVVGTGAVGRAQLTEVAVAVGAAEVVVADADGLAEPDDAGLAEAAVALVAASRLAAVRERAADLCERALAVERAAADPCALTALVVADAAVADDIAEEAVAALLVRLTARLGLATAQRVARLADAAAAVVFAEAEAALDVAAEEALAGGVAVAVAGTDRSGAVAAVA